MAELLKQKNGEPLAMEKQVALLFAANAKFFTEVPTKEVRNAASQFVAYVDDHHPNMLRGIKETGVLSDDAKKELGTAMEEFRLAHKELFAESK